VCSAACERKRSRTGILDTVRVGCRFFTYGPLTGGSGRGPCACVWRRSALRRRWRRVDSRVLHLGSAPAPAQLFVLTHLVRQDSFSRGQALLRNLLKRRLPSSQLRGRPTSVARLLNALQPAARRAEDRVAGVPGAPTQAVAADTAAATAPSRPLGGGLLRSIHEDPRVRRARVARLWQERAQLPTHRVRACLNGLFMQHAACSPVAPWQAC